MGCLLHAGASRAQEHPTSCLAVTSALLPTRDPSMFCPKCGSVLTWRWDTYMKQDVFYCVPGHVDVGQSHADAAGSLWRAGIWRRARGGAAAPCSAAQPFALVLSWLWRPPA